MSLSERLNEDMKQAMKDKDKFKLSVIRMIRSAIKNQEIEQRTALNDDQVLDILTREIKQRKDSLQTFEQAGRDDLCEALNAEIEIINLYMPQPLSKQELDEIVRETIEQVGAASKADMGKVMSALMPKVKGRADGKEVSKTVQDMLV